MPARNRLVLVVHIVAVCALLLLFAFTQPKSPASAGPGAPATTEPALTADR